MKMGECRKQKENNEKKVELDCKLMRRMGSQQPRGSAGFQSPLSASMSVIRKIRRGRGCRL